MATEGSRAQLSFVPANGPADFAEIEKMARQIWPEYYTSIIGPAQVDHMLNAFQSAAVIEGQIKCGYKYYWIVSGLKKIGYLSFLVKADAEMYLSKLYLTAEYRGKGFGRQAMNFVETVARSQGLKKISLNVNKRNFASIHFYEHRYFQNSGPTIQDIGSGFVMDDWIMEKYL